MVTCVNCLRYGNLNSGVRGFSNRIILSGGLTPMIDSRLSEKDLKINRGITKRRKKNAVQPLFSLTESKVSKILFI